jgi:hypothetical protein
MVELRIKIVKNGNGDYEVDSTDLGLVNIIDFQYVMV